MPNKKIVHLCLSVALVVSMMSVSGCNLMQTKNTRRENPKMLTDMNRMDGAYNMRSRGMYPNGNNGYIHRGVNDGDTNIGMNDTGMNRNRNNGMNDLGLNNLDLNGNGVNDLGLNGNGMNGNRNIGMNDNRDVRNDRNMNRDMHRGNYPNTNIEMSRELSARISQQIRGVKSTHVMLTNQNAYVAIKLMHRMDHRPGQVDRMRPGTHYGPGEVTGAMKRRIERIVRQEHPRVRRVYVSSNQNLFRAMNRYVMRVNQGRPVAGLVSEIQGLIRNLFPENQSAPSNPPAHTMPRTPGSSRPMFPGT